ncbi:MAG: alpha/beta fold hydrolase [Candidatus Pacearchaeota archaeon]|jgi:uncharacterized alpha/beta hydrolase family protein
MAKTKKRVKGSKIEVKRKKSFENSKNLKKINGFNRILKRIKSFEKDRLIIPGIFAGLLIIFIIITLFNLDPEDNIRNGKSGFFKIPGIYRDKIISQEDIENRITAIETNDDNYPIIFVHGYSVVENQVSTDILMTFKKIEDKMIEDGIVIQGKVMIPEKRVSNFEINSYSDRGKPISFISTYHRGILRSDNNYLVSEEPKSIIVYSDRLDETIENVLKLTGKNKVNIIAFSMGGLVARETLRRNIGSERVNKLIMIGTPNFGIEKEEIIGFCDSSYKSPECTDMKKNSEFLKELNKLSYTNEKTEFYTIAGSCGSIDNIEYDNLILVNNVKLDFAKENFVINCKDENKYGNQYSFHVEMLNPREVREVYDLIINILNK